jgi:hypothetical protein
MWLARGAMDLKRLKTTALRHDFSSVRLYAQGMTKPHSHGTRNSVEYFEDKGSRREYKNPLHHII